MQSLEGESAEMSHFRKDDVSLRCWFRTDRWLKQDKKWFFHTRERTLEGPYSSRQDAMDGLVQYVHRQSNDLPAWRTQHRVA